MRHLKIIQNREIDICRIVSSHLGKQVQVLFVVFQHASDIRWELRHLRLANINLERVGEILGNLLRLRTLDLSRNRLTTISKEELQSFAEKLEELRLDGNRLVNVTGAFDTMKQLQTLSLAGNRLKLFDDETRKVTFPETLMDHLDKIENLDISNNSFTYIPKKLAEAFGRGNHLKIGLSHNPYYCDYKIKPIHQFMSLQIQSGRCPSEIR